jgi:putrescine importer
MDQSAMPHAMLAHAVESSDASDTAKLDRVFGTASLVMFGLAYLVPLTVFTTFGAVTRMTEGHLPLAYVVTTIAMLFTAFSYASLVRALPFAGSAFAYSTRAFGTRFGFLTGWTLLLDYILLPAINYLLIGIYLHAQFDSVPAAVWILSATVIVSALNVVGVDIVKRASVVLVVAQLVFATIFVAAALLREEVTLSIAPFYEPGVNWSQLVGGAAILCLSFLGFDAVSTLSEEANDPKRTVPRAIMLTTILGGGIFVLLSYAGAVLLPDWQSIVSADSAGLEVMQPLGPTISILFITAFLAGCIASAVASQASVSRILFAMGRDSVLPRRWFGHLSSRFHTPTYSILTVAALSLVVLFISLETVASLISFGALFAFSVVNLSVMRLFLPQVERPTLPLLLRYGVAPLIGLLLTGWLWFHLSPLALTVGSCWLGVGLAYSFVRHGKFKSEMAGA